jgi:hypothetical protein
MKWFGVPRWVFLAVVAGLAAFGAVYGPWSQPSAQVRSIVEGLRTSSVYEQPGSPGVVNAQRARQVIGDRAILMVLLDRTPLPASGDDPRMALCHQISNAIPGDFIWVYGMDDTGVYKGNNCVGKDFPKPTKNGDAVSDFDLTVNIAAQLSAQYRTSAANLTPEIEEFVLTFDAEAAKSYGAIPTRSPIPDRLAGRQLVLACAGMVAGTVVVFFALRWAGLAFRRRRTGLAARRRRRSELDARLNRLADEVLHPTSPDSPADAERQAGAAKRYVLTLDLLEKADSKADFTAAEHEIAALEKELVQ